MQFFDLIIIGGGISGISAAVEAKKQGIDSILILEKEFELGGILNQCIDSGFGLEIFNEDLTGPEFSQRLIDEALKMNISYKVDTTVIELKKDKTVIAVNPSEGLLEIRAKAVIIAVGCVERARSAKNILGNRFAGIYTVGSAQRIVNTEGFLPGKEAVILGTRDLAINMARRLLIEGAKVKAVIEKSGALKRNSTNKIECMGDFGIPLLLNSCVTAVNGDERVEGITVVQTDSEGNALPGSEKILSCDTLLLSVDMIPDDDLLLKANIKKSREELRTDTEGFFVCGNANYVHEDTDSIVSEGKRAGLLVSKYILEEKSAN
jgi:thioredoxin reductase